MSVMVSRDIVSLVTGVFHFVLSPQHTGPITIPSTTDSSPTPPPYLDHVAAGALIGVGGRPVGELGAWVIKAPWVEDALAPPVQ